MIFNLLSHWLENFGCKQLIVLCNSIFFLYEFSLWLQLVMKKFFILIGTLLRKSYHLVNSYILYEVIGTRAF